MFPRFLQSEFKEKGFINVGEQTSEACRHIMSPGIMLELFCAESVDRSHIFPNHLLAGKENVSG